MKKKVLLLNLPAEEQITRRYMCSYVSPESLMPPLELIGLGAIAREWNNAETKLIDAIAEKLDVKSTLQQIHDFAPDVIVSITGFECFEDDMDTCKLIHKECPDSTFVLFGHYATNFPEETLNNSTADYILFGEGDLIFHDLLQSLFGSKELNKVQGIAYLTQDQMIRQGVGERVPNPNELPTPCYDLLPYDSYYEPLLERPYGMIQTSRGCPYQCNFCVKSYGTKLTTLSADRIIDEIKIWKERYNIKSLRFIDDTFTVNRKRVIDMCQKMIEENLDIEWACLSRTDNIDSDLVSWMKKAGCKRIYFGMESGSERMLKIYHKKFSIQESFEAFEVCREHGVESAAFFMSGHPQETEEDFKKTVAFAVRSKLNFASFNPLTPYPGTPMFEEMKDQIDFSIYPYKHLWKDQSIYDDFNRRKKIFYRSFYFRPAYFLSNFSTLLSNLGEFFILGWNFLRYVLFNGKFVISGLKGHHDK